MWIESHQSLRSHPKVKKAARLAGINEFEMIGRLHCLWWWALDYAPDGNLTNYTNDDIEDAVDWTGQRGLFAQALIDCGFNGHGGLIDVTQDSRVIHDWYDYGGKLLERRETNKERMRESRAMHVQRTERTRVGLHNSTEQNKQNNTVQTEQKPSADKPRTTTPLPIQAQVFVDAGGKFPTGSLQDGTTKKDNAIRVMCDTIRPDESSLSLWRQVVSAYCAQWSPKSYTVMINDYYLSGRIPGQQSRQNGNRPAEYTNPMLEAIKQAQARPGYGE